MVLASRFRLFHHWSAGWGRDIFFLEASKRKVHTLSYKPDGIWKKGRSYRAIFEIEYLNPRSRGIEKRKYAIGSWMLAYLAMIQKSAKFMVLVTNNADLYREITTFRYLVRHEYMGSTHALYLKAGNKFNIMVGLKQFIVGKLKI